MEILSSLTAKTFMSITSLECFLKLLWSCGLSVLYDSCVAICFYRVVFVYTNGGGNFARQITCHLFCNV